MAEKKYDLLLVGSDSEKKKKSIPWYKERVNLRYLKEHGHPERVNVGKDWMFLKDGLDDFRDGLPPITDGNIVLRNPNAGLGPNVKSKTQSTPVKQTVNAKRFTREEICYSKKTPLQRKQTQHIGEIEYGLMQHPLALYPHLEESVPPEVFEDVVDLLDPEMTLLENEGADAATVASDALATTRHQEVQTNADSEESQKSGKSQEARHLYSWIRQKDEAGREIEARLRQEPARDPHIEQVTKEFCDWVASLGGESNNIEESTVMSLFASGYETKPALSVPIHVVELTSIPPELRQNIAMPPSRQQDQEEAEMEQEYRRRLGQGDQNWMKFRYGAWYLEPRQWRKIRADEPLVDPEETKDTRQAEARQRAQEMNETLAGLHGAKSFIEFMRKKGSRKPEFLDHVEQIVARREAEERQKAEAEAQRRGQLLQRKSAEPQDEKAAG